MPTERPTHTPTPTDISTPTPKEKPTHTPAPDKDNPITGEPYSPLFDVIVVLMVLSVLGIVVTFLPVKLVKRGIPKNKPKHYMRE